MLTGKCFRHGCQNVSASDEPRRRGVVQVASRPIADIVRGLAVGLEYRQLKRLQRRSASFQLAQSAALDFGFCEYGGSASPQPPSLEQNLAA